MPTRCLPAALAWRAAPSSDLTSNQAPASIICRTRFCSIWTQGYLSAANIYLLNEYTDYVDIGAVTEPDITQLVADFCKANPDKKPISAIDKFIREATKIKAKESDAFDPWEH